MDRPAYLLEFEKPLRELEKQLETLHQQSLENNIDMSGELAAIEEKIEITKRDIYTNLTPWQRVQVARHPKRPYALDYVGALCTDFQELHGDRQFNDDRAMIMMARPSKKAVPPISARSSLNWRSPWSS